MCRFVEGWIVGDNLEQAFTVFRLRQMGDTDRALTQTQAATIKGAILRHQNHLIRRNCSRCDTRR